MAAIAAFTSFGTTSPLYNKQQAMYFPAKIEYIVVCISFIGVRPNPSTQCSQDDGDDDDGGETLKDFVGWNNK